MGYLYKEKVVINKSYINIKGFLKKLSNTFSKSGEIIYKGRNTIKIFNIDNICINVKSFKKPHIINQIVYGVFRDSKAKRSYKYAKKLIALEIDTPTPIAYMEYKWLFLLKHSFYACQHIDVDDEMRVLKHGTLDEHRHLITEFANHTASLHYLNVLHLDYSSGNILFKKQEDGSYKFYLVDLNRMEFDKDIDMKTASYNFRRLWGSDEMIAYFSQKYAERRGFDVDLFTSLVFMYRKQFWTTFNKKYPNVKPYLGEQK